MKRKVHSELVRNDLRVFKKKKISFSQKSLRRISSTVVPEVKEWLKDSVTSHWFLYEKDRNLYIAFHDHSEAMLYKLTWH